jgi:hypothetical protein
MTELCPDHPVGYALFRKPRQRRVPAVMESDMRETGSFP